jgi:hypothetical protein
MTRHYTLVTSLNQHYWDLGSDINIQSWDENFPKNVTIHIFSEDEIIEKKNFSDRIVWHDLYKECPELVQFKEKYKDNPHLNGQVDTRETKKFKWNAIKFAHKTFPLFNIGNSLSSGALIWLDSDVLSIEKFDNNFLESVCPADKSISYLGRPTTYSECGWVYYNLDLNIGKEFLKNFENAYTSGELEKFEETHDSYVFDVIRKNYIDQKSFFNLNADAITDKHPFHLSVLRKKFVHNKGHNKLRKQQKFMKRYNLL